MFLMRKLQSYKDNPTTTIYIHDQICPSACEVQIPILRDKALQSLEIAKVCFYYVKECSDYLHNHSGCLYILDGGDIEIDYGYVETLVNTLFQSKGTDINVRESCIDIYPPEEDN